MGALGLDTSVVVRFLTGEPAELAEIARNRLTRALQDGNDLVIADIVVVEAYYVLQKVYGIPKTASLKALLEIFTQSGFRQEEGGVAVEALEQMLHAASNKPGMVDRMIHARYGKECGGMLSFEKSAGKLERVEVLA